MPVSGVRGGWRRLGVVVDADADVAEAGRGGAVAGVDDLAGLALAAVGRAPHLPVVRVTDRVAAVPELRRDAGVGAVTQQAAEAAVLDLVTHLSAELKVVALVVDGPR